MQIVIRIDDPKPVYEQIVFQIEEGVRSLQLDPGTRLPSIRQLAHDLDLNQNTVAKAYAILETHGIVTTLGRRGTIISKDGSGRVKDKAQRVAQEKLGQVVASLQASGLTPAEIRHAFQAALDAD